MKVYFQIEDMEPEKQIYGRIAMMSKVRVEYDYNGEKYLILPYSFGELTLLVEINNEEEVFNQTLDSYLRKLLMENFVYPEEIKKLSMHFKTDLKKFRILVVKYNNVEEKEFSRYSLSNITFGVVNYHDQDIHILPSSVKIKPRDGYCLSSVVQTPEEGLRQALLVLKWFGTGDYEQLPKLALEKDLELKEWENFLKYFLFSEIDDKYFPNVVRKLNEFRRTTYFDPVKNIEKITLGICVAKSDQSLSQLEFEEFI